MATQPKEAPHDEFSDAFAQFASAGELPANDAGSGTDAVPLAAPDGADGGGDSPADAGVADRGDGDTGVPPPPETQPVEEPPAAASEPSGGTDAPAGESTADAILDRLNQLLKEPAPAAEAPAAEAPAETPELYSQEEKQFLENYDKDWTDVARGEALKRRAEYGELVSFVFQEVAKQLSPMLQTLETLAVRTHLTDLETRVGDYDAVRDKVIAWVDEQPSYLQAAYKQVISSGTVDEVADLVERYRAATGDAVQTAPQSRPVPAELPNDAKQAAQELAPLSTKRSTVPQDDAGDDFDSAFRKWAAANTK